MADAATLAVLKDLLGYCALALVLGVLVYRLFSQLVEDHAAQVQGNVLVRPYGWEDGLAALLLCALLTSNVWSGDATDEQLHSAVPALSTSEQALSICANGGFMLLLALALMSYIRVIRDLDPGEMFGLRTVSVGSALVTALIWILPTFVFVTALAQIANDALAGIWHDLSPQATVKMFAQAQNLLVPILLGASAVFIAPLAEELFFRGYLYGVIKRYTDSYFAALASALVFALVHLHIGTMLPLFALGLVLVCAYEYTGSLLVPIFIHSLFNATSTALLFWGYDS